MPHAAVDESRTHGLAIALAAIPMTVLAGCLGEVGQPAETARTEVVRRSASEMSAAEIDRFRRAFEYAVSTGRFDDFNIQHADHHHARQHGAEVLATSPMTVQFNPVEWAHRLLPWHRAFILEAEAMLRAALRERDGKEGRDPSEADSLFIPYWNAAHDQALPAWVEAFQPKGGTAIAPPGLPPGHAGYGKAVGEKYAIVFGRWPGQNLAWTNLHTPDYVARILARPQETLSRLRARR
jgi:hypothetical protein